LTAEIRPIPALELRGIVKKFGDVLANDHVDLSLDRGEIRALVGENGAGKTTLMRVAYGLYQPDEGESRVSGIRKRFASALDAIGAGLGMVHQHFMLFPDLSVTENVVFGAEPSKFGAIDYRAAVEQIEGLSQRHGLDVDPELLVRDLSVGARQRVEILKALYRSAGVLILDEPTAVLGPRERDGLFVVLEELAAQGTAIVFITHKLPEVMRLADRATVMRDGALIDTVRVADSNPEEISRMMIGRDLPPPSQRPAGRVGRPLLEVQDLSVDTSSGLSAVDRISVEVNAGEIVGVAGAAGNGQSELIEAIAGLRAVAAGSIKIASESVDGFSIARRREAGLAWLPDDRDGLGSALEGSITDNMIMGSESCAPLSVGLRLSRDGCEVFASDRVRDYGVKAASIDARLLSLSGGNRQKVLISRELPLAVTVLLAEQPTRGLDFVSAAEVHQRLLDCRASGRAVLVVSSDLSEILALSDRIMVMFEGRMAGMLDAAEATEERLGLLMSGASLEASVR
jgi:simple sugar transport system ATP-binding protein